jgi:endoglucanase
MSQAWAVIAKGKLAPYTYWYDHAPVGWFLIALWLKLTGGVFTFGFSLNSGRVLMLILHVASTFLLYLIGKKVTGSKIVGIFAGLMFSLSPLAIYFQRRVLLDNIMVFWLFLSLVFLLYGKQKLRWVIASAISFGIAVLSKESAIFFLPFFVILNFTYLHKSNRMFGVFKWVAIAMGIVSLYFLYSLLNGELFPSGTLLGGPNEHVSLMGTLKYQASRGNISIFNPNSSFWKMAKTWENDDPLLLLIGAITTFATLLLAIKSKAARIIGGFALSYWFFLIRGGLVLEFYIIPLIPLISLTTAYITYITYKILWKHLPSILKVVSFIPISLNIWMIGMMFFDYSTNVRGEHNIYTSNNTAEQVAAVDWILTQKLPTQFYAIDNYAYLDLNLKNNGNFKNAEYYWKVDGDKDIKEKILKNDFNNIDYVLFTPLIGGDLGTGEIPMVGKALAQSNPITSFTGDGWYVQIWAVKNSRRILVSTWESYKKNFITPKGNTIDPTSNKTTSEGQSYALLRSVWMNDKTQFDASWKWTKDNLQQSNKLFGWQWGEKKDGSYGLLDKGSAADADEDIALALAFAGKRWNNPEYIAESKEIISAIWRNEVMIMKNKPYLVVGNWAKEKEFALINPSYLSPASYRIFSQIDNSHPWQQLVTSSYEVLASCTQNKLDKSTSVGLPPDWCAINKNGSIIPSPEKGLNSTAYSYDAFRSPWRIALDYQWNKEPRAKTWLTKNDFLRKEWEAKHKLLVGYAHDGKPWENYESAGAYAANLASFVITDKTNAKKIYEEKVLKKLFEDKNSSYWEDPKSYYTQNWAWFGTALYNNDLINLWRENSLN